MKLYLLVAVLLSPLVAALVWMALDDWRIVVCLVVAAVWLSALGWAVSEIASRRFQRRRAEGREA